jgi:phage tail tape-measure protein
VALGSAFILGAAMMLTFFYVAWMSFGPAVRAIRGGLQTVGELQAASGGLIAVIAIWPLIASAAASKGGSASKSQDKRGKFKPSRPSEEVRPKTPHARQSSRAAALDNE